MNIKMFNGNNLPHELLLTTRQKTNLRNAFENNMPTDIKLSKAQISKIIKKKYGFGTTTLIISNKKTNDMMKIVEAVEDSNILLKGATKAINNETKEEKRGFLGMLLVPLRASLLGNMLTRKGIVRAGYGNKEGKGILYAGYG